jgi:thioredoxin reductase (NADPH)
MSSYLVDRLVEDSRIDVHTGTQVVGLHGDDELDRVTLSGGVDGTVPCSALFCFIGAEPATDWLTGVERDEHGFVHTGADVIGLGDAWRELGRMPLPFETSIPRVFGEGSSAVASVHRALAAAEVFA